MNVTIAGMAGSGGTCSEADCLKYNTTYSLYRAYSKDSGDCVWYCEWLDEDCDADEITATLYEAASIYYLKVELGGHVWLENLGSTKPDLCKGGPWELIHQTDGGDCDSSSATCSVAMADEEGHCNCGPPCPNCKDGNMPAELLLTVRGIEDKDCNECTAFFAAPVVCDRRVICAGSACVWGYNFFPTPLCSFGHWEWIIAVQAAQIFVQLRSMNPYTCATALIFLQFTLSQNPPECMDWNNTDIPQTYVTDVLFWKDRCTWEDATVSLTTL